MKRSAVIPVAALLLSVGLTAGLFCWTRGGMGKGVRPEFEAFRSEGGGTPEARLKAPEFSRWNRYPREPEIRVALREQPVDALTLEIDAPYRIRAVGGKSVLMRGARLASCRVVVDEKGLRVGGTRLDAEGVEIEVDRSPAIWVGGNEYRGRVRLYRRDKRVLPVNVLPLEQYIAGVVDSEMPAAFPREARRAQAIVARTYALYQVEQAPRGAVYDLFASTRSQKYQGYQYRGEKNRLLAGESDSSREIAESTRGVVGQHDGGLFCTYYCAVCGGKTVEGSGVFKDAAPVLSPVTCDGCRDARLYRWEAEVTKREAESALRPLLGREGKKLGTVKSLQAVRKGSRGASSQYVVRDDRQSFQVTGAALRQALGSKGLYSPNFDVQDKGQTLLFSGRGHGHGVGLCQWGARGMAQRGATAEQIFRHYYAGAVLVGLGYR
ncbi:MAG: SpoIID/LytB domain-containing protein [Planctomycetaceae bacterium]